MLLTKNQLFGSSAGSDLQATSKFLCSLGQIKTKADWRAIDSPKKRTNESFFFAMTVWKYLKLEISFAFWENLQCANLLLSDL
jgi:hypothetical protein